MASKRLIHLKRGKLPSGAPITWCGAEANWGNCAVTPGSIETCRACKAAYRKG